MSLDSILRVACGHARVVLQLAHQSEPDGQHAAIMLSLLAQHADDLRQVADKLTPQGEHALTCCEVVLAAFEELEIPLNQELCNCTEGERTSKLERAAKRFSQVAKEKLQFLPVEFFVAEPPLPPLSYEPYRAPPKASDILAKNIKAGATRLVTVADLVEHTGLSNSTIKRMARNPLFPSPKKTSPERAWLYEEAKRYVLVLHRTNSGRKTEIVWKD